MSAAEGIGFIGVALLLVGFFLNLFGYLDRSARPYHVVNALGAGLACYASWLIGFVPFVVLEGAWAVVAVIALLRPPSAEAA
ncbi:MAG: hypothetical protein V3T14_04570 [Myxococcota bacterium]